MRSYFKSYGVVLALAAFLFSAPLAAFSCAGKPAPVVSNPAPSQIQETRALAKRIADEVRRGTSIARDVRSLAQKMTAPNGPISAETMNRIDLAAISYGNAMKSALGMLDKIASDPNLKQTARSIWAATKQFIDAIPITDPTLATLVAILRSTFELTIQEQGGAQ